MDETLILGHNAHNYLSNNSCSTIDIAIAADRIKGLNRTKTIETKNTSIVKQTVLQI